MIITTVFLIISTSSSVKFDPDITVIRNDEKTVQDIEAMHPDHLIISPGPGRPADAGVCEEAISYFAGKVPILGVCLGHQAICEIYGGTITYGQAAHARQTVRSDAENRQPVV